MRVLLVTLVIPLGVAAGLITLSGCQTVGPPQDYATVADTAKAGGSVSVADLEQAFFDQPDHAQVARRLAELEQQALQLYDDEPLKLGSVGNAILEIYQGSLIGHLVMEQFYKHVDSTDAVAEHVAWIKRVRDHIEATGDGTREAPFSTMSSLEARAYLRSLGYDPVGSMYQATDELPFGLLLAGKAKSGPNKNLVFDLTQSYEMARADTDATDDAFNPFTLMGYLAKQRDSAAQVYIGAYLVAQRQYEQALGWLSAASTTGNLYANMILARVHWSQAEQAEDETTRARNLEGVLENYLHAIALGSRDAMYTLATLYLGNHFGEDNIDSGVALLKQAAEQEHTDSALYLAHLHYAGRHVDADLDEATRYYRQSAGAGSAQAVHAYVRFLTDRDIDRQFDPDALTWLEDQADADDSESMVLLGNLHATGAGVGQNVRKANRWYRAAVKNSADAAHIVNEVAWTLSVTHQDSLRNPKYALEIMSRMMGEDEDAAGNPAYLDTWAATHAANGLFNRAIEIQHQALSAARAQERDDVIEELETHLELFQAGRAVIDPIP